MLADVLEMTCVYAIRQRDLLADPVKTGAPAERKMEINNQYQAISVELIDHYIHY
jgi:hypothetical protein